MREQAAKLWLVAVAKWSAICGLSLVWALGALLSLTLGGLGKIGHSVASWSLDQILELRAVR